MSLTVVNLSIVTRRENNTNTSDIIETVRLFEVTLILTVHWGTEYSNVMFRKL